MLDVLDCTDILQICGNRTSGDQRNSRDNPKTIRTGSYRVRPGPRSTPCVACWGLDGIEMEEISTLLELLPVACGCDDELANDQSSHEPTDELPLRADAQLSERVCPNSAGPAPKKLQAAMVVVPSSEPCWKRCMHCTTLQWRDAMKGIHIEPKKEHVVVSHGFVVLAFMVLTCWSLW